MKREGEDPMDQLFDQMSRRRFLISAGAAGALVASGGLLAACGSSSSSSGGNSKVIGEKAKGSVSADEIAELKRVVGPFDGPLGGDLTFPLGLSVPQSGQGAVYTTFFTRGPKLAVQHIKALGGPNIQLNIQDNGTGSPQAGVSNMRKFKAGGASVALTTYIADLGAQLPLAKNYEILLLDGAGGTGGLPASPYFWGTRANPEIDAVAGLFKYLDSAHPGIKSVSYAGSDLGKLTNDQVKKAIAKECSSRGHKFPDFLLFPVGKTDYSGEISQLKSASPDFIICGAFARDAGYFIKQARAAFPKVPIAEFGHTPDEVQIAGSAYDGVLLADDYFQPNQPTNPWAKLFVSSYQRAFNQLPDYYAASLYEDTFMVWQLIRKVLAQKGDVKKGSDLQKALEADPTFPTVYGTDPAHAPTLSLDPATHSVAKREMGVYEWSGGDMQPRAYFGIGASDFKLVSS